MPSERTIVCAAATLLGATALVALTHCSYNIDPWSREADCGAASVNVDNNQCEFVGPSTPYDAAPSWPYTSEAGADSSSPTDAEDEGASLLEAATDAPVDDASTDASTTEADGGSS